MNHRIALSALGIGVGLMGLGGLTAVQAQSTKPVPSPIWHNCLTREVWSPEKKAWCNGLNQLQNATYQIPDVGAVTLTNGKYENKEKRILVSLVNQPGLVVFGDLTGNRQEDAAFVLAVNTGGSAVFTYLGTAWNQKGTLKPVTPLLLGDRVRVNLLQISGERVRAELLTHGPKDPLCCPTQKISRSFAFLLQPTLVPIER